MRVTIILFCVYFKFDDCVFLPEAGLVVLEVDFSLGEIALICWFQDRTTSSKIGQIKPAFVRTLMIYSILVFYFISILFYKHTFNKGK